MNKNISDMLITATAILLPVISVSYLAHKKQKKIDAQSKRIKAVIREGEQAVNSWSKELYEIEERYNDLARKFLKEEEEK